MITSIVFLVLMIWISRHNVRFIGDHWVEFHEMGGLHKLGIWAGAICVGLGFNLSSIITLVIIGDIMGLFRTDPVVQAAFGWSVIVISAAFAVIVTYDCISRRINRSNHIVE